MGFKTIIVGLDFSRYSKEVWNQAVVLGKFWNAKLVRVHSISFVPHLMGSPQKADVTRKYIRRAEEKLEKLFPAENLQVSNVVKLGQPFETLNSLAKSKNNSLVVIGHKGLGIIENFFLGSTAQRLVTSCPRPVWVQRGSKVSIPKHILLPHDFSKTCDRSVKLTKEWFHKAHGSLDILHVEGRVPPILDYPSWQQLQELHERSVEKAFARLKKLYPRKVVYKLDGDPARSILNQSKHFDLIAMAPHSRSKFFPHLGSVTTKVLKKSSRPVLIIPPKV